MVGGWGGQFRVQPKYSVEFVLGLCYVVVGVVTIFLGCDLIEINLVSRIYQLSMTSICHGAN